MTRISYNGLPVQRVDIALPSSKSIAARALILAECFDGIEICRLPECDDTRELARALDLLHLYMGRHNLPSTLSDTSDADLPRFDLGSGGTSFRFFLALVASLPDFQGIVDCSDALRRRPVAPLLDPLRKAGADISSLSGDDLPPFRVCGKLLNATSLRVDKGISSQFISALMMASLKWQNPFTPLRDNDEVSSLYIDMTARMISRFEEMLHSERLNLMPARFSIEPDWSAASYFYQFAMMHPDVDIFLGPLLPWGESLQGDSACSDIFGRCGVMSRYNDDGELIIRGDGMKIKELKKLSRPMQFDMSATPDLVPALAMALAYARIPFDIIGVGHLKYKECDRLNALHEILSRSRFNVSVTTDTISVNDYSEDPGAIPPVLSVDSHGDHRMVMCAAISALCYDHVVISDAVVVGKSFPGFFDQLSRLGYAVGEV
ncbi:MAG: 3-phosphoshikimate 1-carboxyvinyltransferase [Lepagella sp.]